MNIKSLCIIVGVLLLIAIFPLPYGYYTFLRLIVFISSLILTFHLREKALYNLSLAMIVLAILFNPIIPVYLSREIWLPIDLASAGLFFITANSVEKHERTSKL